MNRHTSYTIYNNIQRVLTNRIRIILMIVLACAMAGNIQARKKTGSVTSDRQQWADLCYRIARACAGKHEQWRTPEEHGSWS